MQNPVVSIVLGSKSDEPKIQKCLEALTAYNIPFETNIMSAHRTPKKVAALASGARARGIKVFIAAAGLAAALPGTIAAHTTLPVIGIPLAAGVLNGTDALYAIVQMPPGIPVATVGIDNGANAAHLAAQILAVENGEISRKIAEFRAGFGDDQ
ncbi:MAG: 5-(carboxyamino)imidazole ribonucleotide mutase [Candidatus Raymondbacteria bacterium RifOxyA12_full_50_37]|uniref:N5-carboxyaminoimidazole ribonucleotide mutase n=1 Tax=Candidatus Raymondbacteria bacterium RIFOXYD12_FULL_49_13 TaxID=1817890 RepID=A0A1F7EZK9_UNCRA|nr:MAG: 5-(carboxyamino)imidazole ribonucleotide mutase [Candidatus Raymondbacteria bacterium RifOxyA12_full_50_37]OGJ92678.1 MAG: 5-(carboxyamino)imidazole ribonucleotide mutase [Candidatus Raymondbacteria bacterium RIFOXYA2_FULL_49_16]OGJ93080.1 MAG: 5-(carboxyamino)imidazole ribonucleotide mutase [Candidatus Raymondbacteria bacterium RifOxyC12_full_50_8]OGJ99023.1 MAG: 5-(carboxyamino)imidazole ribonucleotide mutase [Candidatus Raymondbacteria bacterium RIFOXYC2_FULL_50_21]OGJ99391.1 MAG: 5-